MPMLALGRSASPSSVNGALISAMMRRASCMAWNGRSVPLARMANSVLLSCASCRFVDATAQLLRQRQQQRFTHRRAHHARGLMQRLDADHQQVKTLGAQAGSDMLFQQRVQQRRIWQFGHRMAGAEAAHVGMRLGQRLLIAVVVAHQQAELVVWCSAGSISW